MGGFFDKMGNFFFKDDDREEYDNFEEKDIPTQIGQSNDRNVWKEKSIKKANLISVPNRNTSKSEPNAMEMVLVKATSYDDMQDIAKHIKERKVAVVNFEEMDKDIAQRMVDFLSGATFALDGVPRKVSGGTFIFSSSSVGMVGQIMEKNDGLANDFLADERFSTNQWLKK